MLIFLKVGILIFLWFVGEFIELFIMLFKFYFDFLLLIIDIYFILNILLLMNYINCFVYFYF